MCPDTTTGSISLYILESNMHKGWYPRSNKLHTIYSGRSLFYVLGTEGDGYLIRSAESSGNMVHCPTLSGCSQTSPGRWLPGWYRHPLPYVD